MGPLDWNILTLSIHIYNKYIFPQLSNWGVFEFLHYLQTLTSQWVMNVLPTFTLKSTSIAALITAFKFLILIALLIFIRGGVPRYRYDFLTKIGWIKFLSLVLAVFLSSLLFTLMF